MYATTIMETSAMKAWERAVLFIAKSPLELKFGGGDEIKIANDSQVSFILDENAVNEVLSGKFHPSDPFCTPKRINEYCKEYTKDFQADIFDYTYREILEKGFKHYKQNDTLIGKAIKKIFGVELFKVSNINQIELLRNGLQKQIDEGLGSNRNVAVLFNPAVIHFSDKAIPCWNEILVRWEGNGQCSIHTIFRSHDCGSAEEANWHAMMKFIYEEIVKPCGCIIKYWHEVNYSLHIYEYDLSIMDNLIIVNRNPQLIVKQAEYDRISQGMV